MKCCVPTISRTSLRIRPVGADRGAQRDATVADDLGRHEPDAADIGVTVVFAEAKPLRQVRANDIAVEYRHLAAMLEQQHRQHLGRG